MERRHTDIDASEYRRMLDALIVRSARQVVAEEAMNAPDNFSEGDTRKLTNRYGSPLPDELSGIQGQIFALIDGAFHEEYPLGVIQHCEHNPIAPPSELAELCENAKDFTSLYAHAVLATTVLNALGDLLEGSEVAGIRIEENEQAGTMAVTSS